MNVGVGFIGPLEYTNGCHGWMHLRVFLFSYIYFHVVLLPRRNCEISSLLAPVVKTELASRYFIVHD